jgi:hypothetical protein
MPEVCPAVGGIARSSSDLRSAIERAEHALDARSIGRLARALVALRATFRSRATQRDAEQDVHLAGPWKRRLRRRYAASMCAIERLLETTWASCDFDAVQLEARAELARLRRLESLEDAVHLDQHWTDLGVGD